MSRIQPVEAEQETVEQKALLELAHDQLGAIPNLTRVLAHAPAALRAYLGQNAALQEGILDERLAEQLAVAVGGANGCDYCASAHTMLAAGAGVSADELSQNLHGEATDERTAAVLGFARLVVANRGLIGDDDITVLRAVGLSTAEVVEVLAHVGMNLFTNYFNHVAQTEIDFPSVCTLDARINA